MYGLVKPRASVQQPLPLASRLRPSLLSFPTPPSVPVPPPQPPGCPFSDTQLARRRLSSLAPSHPRSVLAKQALPFSGELTLQGEACPTPIETSCFECRSELTPCLALVPAHGTW
jgi:hypothetical protein